MFTIKTNTAYRTPAPRRKQTRPDCERANPECSDSSPRLILTFVSFAFAVSSPSCWYICRKSSSQQMKLTVHPIRARPGRARTAPNPFKGALRRSLLAALAPLPQQRRSDGLIPLTWAANTRSDIAATSDRHEEGVYASVRSRKSLPAGLR